MKKSSEENTGSVNEPMVVYPSNKGSIGKKLKLISDAGRGEKETKTKRVNLIIQPTLFEEFKKISYMKKTSTNDLICEVLKKYCSENAELLKRYDEVFGG